MGNLRELLTVSAFDPLSVDVALLNEVTEAIPSSGFIDLGMAQVLSVATLKAADYATDLIGQSVAYVSYCEGRVKAAKASAIKDLLMQKKPSTIVVHTYGDDERYS